MVEPEVFHHRFELAVAINGAVELGHRKFGEDSIGALHFGELFLRFVQVGIAGFDHLGQRVLLFYFLLIFILLFGDAKFFCALVGVGKFIEQFSRGHGDGGIALQASFERRVID